MQSILHPLIGPSGPYSRDLTGKVAIITGGALGIGFEVSKFMALMGCKVIMVNRKEPQGNEAIEKITKAKGETQGDEGVENIRKIVKDQGKDGDVEWVGCDLGKLSMVKEVFGGLAKKLDRLDYVSSHL
jgi:NAD(P)-dependent dehydrogenase (short-subunit alcohol dehydrogenase family)